LQQIVTSQQAFAQRIS